MGGKEADIYTASAKSVLSQEVECLLDAVDSTDRRKTELGLDVYPAPSGRDRRKTDDLQMLLLVSFFFRWSTTVTTVLGLITSPQVLG
jgi:hypothetical protein